MLKILRGTADTSTEKETSQKYSTGLQKEWTDICGVFSYHSCLVQQDHSIYNQSIKYKKLNNLLLELELLVSILQHYNTSLLIGPLSLILLLLVLSV